jgi:GTP cyclohydrolase IA
VAADFDRIPGLIRDLLVAIGEDPDRDGLADTPDRVARWWREFVDHDPGTTDTTFAVEHVDQLVVVSGLRVWSLCEHHLLPFWADVTVGYLADARVLGLSKFARIAHDHAHRLQVQERLVAGVADDVEKIAGTPSVAVVATGEHLCMTMRGVRTVGTMTTSVIRGNIRDSDALRDEWLRLSARR